MISPILLAFLAVVVVVLSRSIRIVPQRMAFLVERLGRYRVTLTAGFHVLVPFIDLVTYKHSLKEMAIDVPSQVCITKDNISVEIDGIIYLQVMDPKKASYGIDNYLFATTQIAQTTMRSIVGTMNLDETFEQRETMNGEIVSAVDKASDPWGIKITRYEVKDIKPPQSIKDAMEKQMRAVREKRAAIAVSEGDKESRINRAEGEKQELIAKSEGEKQKRINEAEGEAFEIAQVAEATAVGIQKIAEAIGNTNGNSAVNLRVAEQYIKEFGNLAKTNNTMILPSNLTDVSGLVATAMSVIEKTGPSSKSTGAKSATKASSNPSSSLA